ncbi:MAG: suppressor of fused domain protein [Deltaproteobacteria bacterium]|nr:suppressor of fused domain protein [Deltaproteobacteria bacterium]
MDYHAFYAELFGPVEELVGPIDPMTIVALIGFDAGGPLNLCTVGRDARTPFVTYVTCELAVRDDQATGYMGPYELMMTCDDEDWCRPLLSDIGRMTLEDVFEHGHTLDVGAWVGESSPIQGVVFEEFARLVIEGRPFGILRVTGVTRDELDFATEHSVDKLVQRLKAAGVCPQTSLARPSALTRR